MELPQGLEIKQRLSKRLFIGKLHDEEIVIKIFTLEDLESGAAEIKHVFDDLNLNEYDQLETTLQSRVLYCVNIHYIIQKQLSMNMSVQYYCEKTNSWEMINVIENNDKMEDHKLKSFKTSFVHLKHIIGLDFNLETEQFIFRNQSVGLVFQKLGEPIMSCTRDLKWTINASYKSIFLNELEIAKFFKEIVFAVAYLFDNFNIVHKDIKIENICSISDKKNGRFHPVLIDFGESQLLQKNRKLRDAYGTHMMLPPESFTSSFYTNDDLFIGYDSEKREAWTLGCLLHIMVFGYSPLFEILLKSSPLYFQLSLCDLDQIITIPDYSELLKSKISCELKNLLLGLLNKDPNFRFGFHDILNHPWFLK